MVAEPNAATYAAVAVAAAESLIVEALYHSDETSVAATYYLTSQDDPLEIRHPGFPTGLATGY